MTDVTQNKTQKAVNGAEIYQQYCALCHGKDGRYIPTGAFSALVGRDATS